MKISRDFQSKQKKALITGISGFVGFELYKYLQKVDPYLVICGIDRSVPAFSGSYEFIQADILDPVALAHVVSQVKPDYIFHLAGVNVSHDYKLIYDTNIIGTINLLEAARKNKDDIDPVILNIGSAAEYGIILESELPVSEDNPLRPINHYGVSKVAQDLAGFQYFNDYGLKVIRTRPFNIIGPGQSTDFVCGALAKQIYEVKTGKGTSGIRVGNLETERDFIDVRDVVEAYWRLILSGKSGEVYNIGSGRCYTIKRVVDILISEAQVEIRVVQDEKKIRRFDVPKQISNIGKIKKLTGWMPKISIEESLRDMLKYHSNN